MMIGILGIEVNADQVRTKVLELMNSFDSKIKSIAKKCPPRVSVDELKREIKEYDTMFSLSEITPKLFLKGKISDYAWYKFRSILE